MEQKDIDLIEQLVGQDSEIDSLWAQHKNYQKIIDKMERKSYLNETETQEVKELKKKKLAGKTKLHALLEKHK
ncbi:DUF465 domain-containing protein [Maridesulfovibrio hydrothermalis]|uniref:DUF465 domain-containing protein n=1 Tax=Maridesulfovibrio hydrothermalis AM13 = DSM 14728 TaxID=1121451 RepID=L0RGT8_9BACT|nr:DUF465 domain-containing protein [Maridesulfovibrio hydrothermalis]CCO24806.1 conserved protein of unknown function [Maridesulfovibrio hydrothermalis AM13 = DSM 14728]